MAVNERNLFQRYCHGEDIHILNQMNQHDNETIVSAPFVDRTVVQLFISLAF